VGYPGKRHTFTGNLHVGGNQTELLHATEQSKCLLHVVRLLFVASHNLELGLGLRYSSSMNAPLVDLSLRNLWGTDPNRWKYLPHEPSPKQREFLKLSCREGMFGGAAGGGKSDALLMAALQGIDIPNYSAILFRKTLQDLKLSGALMDRAHQWWDNTDVTWNSDDKVFTFPTGARIGFGYLDGPRDHLRYQSSEYHFAGFDETSQFPERQYLYLMSRLRKNRDFCAWMPVRLRGGTNPGGIGHEWIKNRYRITDEAQHEIIDIYEHGKLIRSFVPSLAYDNPGLDVEDYMLQLSELDPITRAQLERGEWISDGTGLVYYCYRPEHCDTPCLPLDVPRSEWCYVLGMDYASARDKTCFAVCAYSPHEPCIYGVWCEAHKNMSPSESAVRALELEEQFGGFEFMVGDSGGLGAAYVLEMQKHWAIPVEPAEKKNKRAFIRLQNGELANGRFKIIPEFCQPWVTQAKYLLWKNDNQLIENPNQENDSTDAMLYCWRECRHYVTRERKVVSDKDPFELAAEERYRENAQKFSGFSDPFGMNQLFEQKDGNEIWSRRVW
jgi:hypothetical protein